MAITLGQQANKIPKRNLILWLDPNNINSYNPDVNKETWYDLTRFKSNWQISPTAYKVQNGVKYFDFNGSFGCAKTSDLSNFVVTGKDQNHVTYIVWTRVLNSTANWRTLVRGNDGYSNGAASMLGDHHVMINNGGWEMGKYDNNTGGGMITTGLLQTQLPNYGTSQWMMLHVRWSSGSPYMRFSWNDTPGTIRGQSTDVRASHRVGFASIGAHHNGSSNVLESSQYWGDIAFFGVWNRELSDAEIMDVWNSTASTYGFTVSQQATSSAITYQNATVQNSATISQTRGELISINTYGGVSSNGTFTWTKPAECTKVHVKVTGGGGGACGYCESGGAGGYAEKWIDVTNVSTVSVTVGGGGNSTGYYSGAGNGGTSSFGSYVSASGGYGANQNYSHSGGHGGVGSGGQINLYGGDGTGHANSHGYYPGGNGGGSFWGASTTVSRPSVVGKQAHGAPGSGGPGSRTDDGGGGSSAYGENGIVVVYNYK